MKIFLLVAVAVGVISSSNAKLSLNNEGEFREARAAIFTTESKSGWFLFDYVGPSTIHFTKGGEGTTDEILPNLDDNGIQYILLRIEVEGGSGSRDVFIESIGSGVGKMEKVRKAVLHGDAAQLLQPFHSDVTVLNKGHFNDETVKEASNPLSGSHVIN